MQHYFYLWITVASVFDFVSYHTADASRGLETHKRDTHILNDPTFWRHFRQEVQSKSWRCNFPGKTLLDSMEEDAKLYADDSVLRRRRHGALPWIGDDDLWTGVVLGACQELANGTKGPYSQQLEHLQMLDALADFVDHLDYFYRVAALMQKKGHPVKAFSQDSSQVHDIDKLDPVMLVGYSERFEDQATTSVWDACVRRHTRVNPHHQAHCVWHDCCRDPGGGCTFCESIRTMALREMVCDKVSRRVQKSLGGQCGVEMWDVETEFFAGLPEDWLDKAVRMMHDLKEDDSFEDRC